MRVSLETDSAHLNTNGHEKIIDDFFILAGKELVKYTQRSISIPFPPASSPGNPPHLRTGKLKGSVRYEYSVKQLELIADIEYAKFLEFGTWKMAPRPFLRPALHRVFN